MKLATAQERSANKKLSLDQTVSATYVAQTSCADLCPYRDSGCYAEQGTTAFTTRRLNRAGIELSASALDCARAEAKAIATLSGKYPLRLHVVGDCRDDLCATIVANAAERYMSKHNQPVWTYTHALNVSRESWGKVSVLRSCDSVDQLQREYNRGYACAMVVPEKHTSRGVVSLGNGFRGIPCPQQTGASESCKTCKLCWNDKNLHLRKLVILFQPDGTTAKRLEDGRMKMLPMIQGETNNE